MSGFCAILDLSGAPVEEADLRSMLDAAPHRGPEGNRVVTLASAALAHQALHWPWITVTARCSLGIKI